MDKVFFIGDVAQDEYYTADRFPKIKEKIIVHELPPMMGGSIANAACVYAALGGRPYFMTALNRGHITKKLLASLNEYGINTEHMVFDDSIPDARCLVILAEDEHTVFIPTLGIKRIDISEKAFEMLKESDFVYTNFCEIAPVAYGDMKARDILKTLKENGTRVFCDADCGEMEEGYDELLRYMDVLFVNEMGEISLQNIYGSRWKEKLFEMGLSTVIVTRAGDGSDLYESNGNNYHVKGIQVPVADVTGAGDTFGAGFLYARTKSDDNRLCAEFANYMAARSVTGVGARYGSCAGADIRGFISEHGGRPEDFEIILRGNDL